LSPEFAFARTFYAALSKTKPQKMAKMGLFKNLFQQAYLRLQAKNPDFKLILEIFKKNRQNLSKLLNAKAGLC